MGNGQKRKSKGKTQKSKGKMQKANPTLPVLLSFDFCVLPFDFALPHCDLPVWLTAFCTLP